MKPIQYLLLLLLLAICPLSMSGRDYADPASLPDPRSGSRAAYVCNPDGLLSDRDVQQLNMQINAIEREVSVEIAVVVVNSIGESDELDFADELGKRWKVGKKSNDNGLIMLIVMDTHTIRIMTGYGLEGVLPDAVCSRIINQDMAPRMRQGNLYGAISDGLSRISAVVTDKSLRDEM